MLDAAARKEEILRQVARARSAEFREGLKGMTNPYGDGTASETIVRVLTTVPLGVELLVKKG